MTYPIGECLRRCVPVALEGFSAKERPAGPILEILDREKGTKVHWKVRAVFPPQAGSFWVFSMTAEDEDGS